MTDSFRSLMMINVLNSEIARHKLQDKDMVISDQELMNQFLMNQQYIMIALLEGVTPGTHKLLTKKMDSIRPDGSGGLYYSE